jgi:hypothetical protein
MNEEEDRLLYGIISLVSSLTNFMVNLCKKCIFGFLKEEVASKLIEFAFVLYTFFQHSYQLSNLEINVVMDYNQECLLPFLINGLLQFGKVVHTITFFFYVVLAFCLPASCFLNGFYLPFFLVDLK